MKIRHVLISTVLSAFLLGTNAFAGMPELSAGMAGEWTRALQMRLIKLGYTNVARDGEFGDATVDAVKRFQANEGLTDDGTVGQMTIEALYNESVELQVDSATYTIKLTPPYEVITKEDDSSVLMKHGNNKCVIKVANFSELEDAVSAVTEKAEQQRLALDAKGVETYNSVIETNMVQINERDAAVIKQSYEYTKKDKNMNAFYWYTIMPVSEGKVLLVKNGFTAEYETAMTYLDIYTGETGMEICENIEGGLFSDAPGLVNAEYEFLGEDASFKDALPLIMQYVDADDDASDAALYYGGRLAELYKSYGNLEDPDLRYSTIGMASMIVTFDHPDLYEQIDVFGEKLNTCVAALEREDASERLASMGMSEVEATDIENLKNEAIEAVLAGIRDSASQSNQ